MKRNAKFRGIVPPYAFAIAVFASLLCLGASPDDAMAKNSSPKEEKQIAAQVTGPASVMVGEPLLLKWRLTNHLKHPVSFEQAGDVRRTWVSLELRDSDDQLVYKEPVQPSESLSCGIADVAPEESAEGTIVASSRVLPKLPGRYTLRAQVVITCQQIENGKAIGQLFRVVRTIDAPIKATPSNDENLRKMAGSLRQRFLSEKGADKDVVLKALLSMKESAALPAWRALAEDPRLDRDGYGSGTFAMALGELATPASVDVLVGLWGGDSSASTHPGVKSILQQLYIHTTDAALKAHIRKGFEAVGNPSTDLYDGPIRIYSNDVD